LRRDICNDELILSHTIPNPVEQHVDGFAAFLLNAVCGNANSGSIVAHYDGRVLGITHICQQALCEVMLRVVLLQIALRIRLRQRWPRRMELSWRTRG
jgi:hypothetical protein